MDIVYTWVFEVYRSVCKIANFEPMKLIVKNCIFLHISSNKIIYTNLNSSTTWNWQTLEFRAEIITNTNWNLY